MPQPNTNTKTKYRPLPAALLTLVVLLASTLLIWLAVVRPQLGKGRTETLCDNFDRSELLADGDTAAQVFTYDKALYTIGLEFYLPGAQPQGELEVVLSDADTGEELARSTGVMQNIIPDQYPPRRAAATGCPSRRTIPRMQSLPSATVTASPSGKSR